MTAQPQPGTDRHAEASPIEDALADLLDDSRYEKVSVTIPAALLARVRGRVGSRGLSRHVAAALEREERRRALRDHLDFLEEEHGPVPAEVMVEARRLWPA